MSKQNPSLNTQTQNEPTQNAPIDTASEDAAPDASAPEASPLQIAPHSLTRQLAPETVAGRQARQGTLSPPVAALLSRIDAQHQEQVALWQARLDDAQAFARQWEREAENLRELLRQREETMREREETTRETLTHMDMIYEENKARVAEAVTRAEAEMKQQADTHRQEVARLWDDLAAAQESAKPKRKWFGGKA